MAKVHYIMIGGFLGAGKTTGIIKLATHLQTQGKRVGLITNDQSIGLVDTARVKTAGLPVEEITGGCFCCKFNSLVEASDALTKNNAPDVLIAEPVGSCTDLKATVSYPLRKIYGERYRVGPLAVFVDPQRCGRILGVNSQGGNFSEKVVYVYRKQLEEAEIIVINKVDTVTAAGRKELADAVKKAYPKAQVMEVSCTTGEGLEGLFAKLMGGELGREVPMEVDYDTYADGEALLGWLNARVELQGAEFDGNAMLVKVVKVLRDRLAGKGVEIAHLKLTLMPDEGPDMGSLSLTQTNEEPVATHRLKASLSKGILLVNLRAEVDPEVLKREVKEVVAGLEGVSGNVVELAAFRPGRPTPTHRMMNSE